VAKVSPSARDHSIRLDGFYDAYLELVLASLCRWGWVEEINSENLNRQHLVSVYSFKISISRNPSKFLSYNSVVVSMTVIILLSTLSIKSDHSLVRSCQCRVPNVLHRMHGVIYCGRQIGNSLPWWRFKVL
jgi:hypothetical protein